MYQSTVQESIFILFLVCLAAKPKKKKKKTQKRKAMLGFVLLRLHVWKLLVTVVLLKTIVKLVAFYF